MHNITMAMQITKDNYPVAVACLGAGFVVVPFDKVVGRYLVMNEIGVLTSTLEDHLTTKHFAISNSWYEADDFFATYNANTDGDPTVPFPVTHR